VLGGTTSAKSFKSLARKEIKRAQEFGQDAVNKEDSNMKLSELKKQLGISIEEKNE
jgi:hypothetical protein